MASYLPYLHFSNFSPFSYCSRPVAPKGMVRRGIRATNTFMSPRIHSLDRGALPLGCTQKLLWYFYSIQSLKKKTKNFSPFTTEMSPPFTNTITAHLVEAVRTSTCGSPPLFVLSVSHRSRHSQISWAPLTSRRSHYPMTFPAKWWPYAHLGPLFFTAIPLLWWTEGSVPPAGSFLLTLQSRQQPYRPDGVAILINNCHVLDSSPQHWEAELSVPSCLGLMHRQCLFDSLRSVSPCLLIQACLSISEWTEVHH